MSVSTAVVRFPDGTFLYGGYQNTSDVQMRCLSDDPSASPYYVPFRECTCGELPDKVEVANNYADGTWWRGLACPRCKVFLTPCSPFESGFETHDGLPDWWEDAFKEES